MRRIGAGVPTLLLALLYALWPACPSAAEARILLDEAELRPLSFATGLIEAGGWAGGDLRLRGSLWDGSSLALFIAADPDQATIPFLIHVPPELRALILEGAVEGGSWERLAEEVILSRLPSTAAGAGPEIPLHSPLSGPAPPVFDAGGREGSELARQALTRLFASPRPFASALALALAFLAATALRFALGRRRGPGALPIASLAALVPILGCAAGLGLLPPRAELFTLPLSDGRGRAISSQLLLYRASGAGYSVSAWEPRAGEGIEADRLYAARTPEGRPLPLHLLATGEGREAPTGLWILRPEPLVRVQGGEYALDFGGLGLAWVMADGRR